jgi:choline transport protein
MSIEKGSIMETDKSVLERSSSGSKSIEDGLASEGQVEELRREFSVWSLGSLCLCLMATWEAVTSVVAAALTNGGAPCLFYN